MEVTNSTQKLNSISLMVIAAVALTGALIYTKTILIPLLISFFIYESITPFINLLKNKFKLTDGIAILVTVLIFLFSTMLFTFLVANSLENFSKGSELYKQKIATVTKDVIAFANSKGIEVNASSFLDEFSNATIFKYLKNATGSFFSILSNILLIILFVCFLLAGESKSSKRSDFSKEVNKKISSYISTKIMTSMGTGILVMIILSVFSVKLAFMIGVLTFLLNFIPNIGSVLATLLPLPLLMLSYGTSWQTPVVLALCGGVQFLIGNVLEPKLMGQSMSLHPVTILVFLLFWGLVWGIPGMFLAVPITAVLKIILERIEITKGLAGLMSGE